MNAQTAHPLLTRDDFREGVFARDKHRCVICKAPAVDAHHILERRLFPDGGYYMGNGASVCAEHHMQCEQTTISTEEVRRAAGIDVLILPPHLYRDQEYDKWGNILLPNGSRLRGELFWDESVQKVLAGGGVLSLFSDRVKYPRTHHVPFSPGMTDDDRVLESYAAFEGQRVIVTEKLDGENSTLYRDGMHARSVTSGNHESRSWLKRKLAEICDNIPEGWRVCGENMYAEHSIAYDDLRSYFYAFSLWNERNVRLGWDESKEWFELIGVEPVPVLYDGIFDLKAIESLHRACRNGRPCEGWVMQLARPISYGEFRSCVAKYVRANHVATGEHWMYGKKLTPNRLAPGVSAW